MNTRATVFDGVDTAGWFVGLHVNSVGWWLVFHGVSFPYIVIAAAVGSLVIVTSPAGPGEDTTVRSGTESQFELTQGLGHEESAL